MCTIVAKQLRSGWCDAGRRMGAEAGLAAGRHQRPQLVRHQVVSQGRYGEILPDLP